MPKKASTTDASKNFTAFRFINLHLDKTDKAWLAENASFDKFGLDLQFDLVATGFKFSLNYDAGHNTYIASLTDVGETSPTKGCVLTGRGSTAADAWFSLAYKHFVLAKEDWQTIAATTEKGADRFG